MPRTRRPDVVVAQQAIRQTPNNQPTQPPAAPTGLPYGEHQQLTDSQRAVPLPAAPNPAAPSPAAAAPPAGGPSAPAGGFDQAMGAALAHPPLNLPPIDGPSQRPWEPTTAGMATGPGRTPVPPGAVQKVSQLYIGMYQQTGDPTWARLARSALAQGN